MQGRAVVGYPEHGAARHAEAAAGQLQVVAVRDADLAEAHRRVHAQHLLRSHLRVMLGSGSGYLYIGIPT